MTTLEKLNGRGLAAAVRVWQLAERPWFWPAVLIGFAATAVFFSVVVYIPRELASVDGIPFIARESRVPDEFRHIGNIFYYATLPLSSGPIITNAPDAALWLGEVERFPSYLYYYVMSFPTRALQATGMSHEAVVIVLRLLTATTGLASLVLVRRVLLALGASVAVVGWTAVAVALTGRFVWQSAAVSYDMPSMALFLLFLLAGVRVMQTASARWYLVLVASAFTVSVTKYTYMPFVVVAVVALTVWVAYASRRRAGPSLVASARSAFVSARASTISLSLLVVVTAGLFIERIITNYVRFGDADPDCDLVHTRDVCMANYDIFSRNELARSEYLAQVADGSRAPAHYAPLEYTGTWADIYYQSTFFYRGPGTAWGVSTVILVLGFIALIVAAAVIVLNARALLRTPTRVFIATMSVLYAAGIYFFNLRTYLSVETYFAHSGRYLLPIEGFAIAATLAGGAVLLRAVPQARRGLVYIGCLAFIAIVALTHNSIVSFLAYAVDPAWYSELARTFMMKVVGFVHLWWLS